LILLVFVQGFCQSDVSGHISANEKVLAMAGLNMNFSSNLNSKVADAFSWNEISKNK